MLGKGTAAEQDKSIFLWPIGCVVIKGGRSLPGISEDALYCQHRSDIGVICSLGSLREAREDYLIQ